jgi:hypothetical protein
VTDTKLDAFMTYKFPLDWFSRAIVREGKGGQQLKQMTHCSSLDAVLAATLIEYTLLRLD